MSLSLAAAFCVGLLPANATKPPSGANPVVMSATRHRTLPPRGMLMRVVRQRYGTPLKKYPPVGGYSPVRPPITRWDYDDFSVFFEHHIVIDTVVPHHPPPIYHVNQLEKGA